MNNNIYVSSNSGKDRIDPESSKTKSEKTGSGQNFRKYLHKDKEGGSGERVKDSTDVSELLDETTGLEQLPENAEDQVFSLFQPRPKVKSSLTPFKTPPTLARQEVIANADVKNPDEPEFAVDENGETDTANPEKQVASESTISNTPVAASGQPVVAKKEVRSIFSPDHQKEIEKGAVARESPAAVFAKIRKEPLAARSHTMAEEIDDSTKVTQPLPLSLTKTKAKGNEANPFPHEEIDISRLGPQGAPPVVALEGVAVATAEKPVPVISKDMQLLIAQILKEISVVSTGDKTETTLILKHPPIFDGAQVVITGFGSAKGELNISFGNLTQNAQNVVQQQQQLLLTALETKGYHVHIFTATTAEIQPIILTEGQTPNSRQQQREEGRGSREGSKGGEGEDRRNG
ncbi:MAG: hypothetical protein H0T62_05665 [Parachlamydiaceae bacterium]|nr:hypothetical protein [Parachlamydiaceae bacterium]